LPPWVFVHHLIFAVHEYLLITWCLQSMSF
jgi:hypothetical protein